MNSLAIDRVNLDVRANPGVVEYFRSQYAKAAADLRSALEIDPNLGKIRALRRARQSRVRHPLAGLPQYRGLEAPFLFASVRRASGVTGPSEVH